MKPVTIGVAAGIAGLGVGLTVGFGAGVLSTKAGSAAFDRLTTIEETPDVAHAQRLVKPGFSVSYPGNWRVKPPSNDIQQKLSDLQLLFEGHRRARALLAVAQSCIKNDDLVVVALHRVRVLGRGRHCFIILCGATSGVRPHALKLLNPVRPIPWAQPGGQPGVMRPRGR